MFKFLNANRNRIIRIYVLFWRLLFINKKKIENLNLNWTEIKIKVVCSNLQS